MSELDKVTANAKTIPTTAASHLKHSSWRKMGGLFIKNASTKFVVLVSQQISFNFCKAVMEAEGAVPTS